MKARTSLMNYMAINSTLTRRTALSGLAATAVAGLVPSSAMAALTTAQAKALIDRLVKEINRVINSGKSEEAMYRDFEKIFAKYSDVPAIARYALGADARRATPAQMRAFTKAFRVYISRKYGKRFREFIGGKIVVKQARKLKKFYEVKTIALLKGQEPFEVVFHVSDRSGKNLFFNIFIEGINMLLNEREEIGAMLDKRKGNLDRLIKDLPKLA